MSFNALKINKNLAKYSLFLVLLIQLGCSSERDPDAALAMAREAFDNKNYAVMEIELKNVLRAQPDNAEARFLLAEANLEFARGLAAEVQLDKARNLGLEPARLIAPYLRAWMYQKKYDQVLDSEKAGGITADIAANDAALQSEVQAITGIALLAKQRLEEAQERFKKAIALDGANAVALTGSAQLAYKQEDNTLGDQRLAEALEKAPDYAPAWSLAGDVRRVNKDLEGSIEAYSQAIKLRPSNADDRLARGLIYLGMKDRDGAKKDINALIKSGYRVPHAAYLSGVLGTIDGDIGLAKDHFESVVAKNPQYMKAVCYLGLTLAATESFERAEANLERCVATYPGAAFTRRAYTLVLTAQGNIAAAKKQLAYLAEQ